MKDLNYTPKRSKIKLLVSGSVEWVAVSGLVLCPLISLLQGSRKFFPFFTYLIHMVYKISSHFNHLPSVQVEASTRLLYPTILLIAPITFYYNFVFTDHLFIRWWASFSFKIWNRITKKIKKNKAKTQCWIND